MKLNLKALAASALFTASTVLASNVLAASGPLIDAGELKSLLQTDAPLLLDIRQGKAADKETPIFQSGHIASSVPAPYALFRGTKTNPGQLIEEEKLETTLQNLGVTKSQPIVIVYQGGNETDFGAAARVYWTLKSSGLTDLSILNGGINAWKASNGELTKGGGEPIVKSNIDIEFSDKWLATTADIKQVVADEAKVDLVDARPVDFWEGRKKHPAAARPGTLPQSRYFAHSSWFNDTNASLVDASKISGLVSKGNFAKSERIVSFCNTGHWAATNWFALSELGGLDNVALYPGSLVEYSNSDGEMINTPGLLKNLINRATGN